MLYVSQNQDVQVFLPSRESPQWCNHDKHAIAASRRRALSTDEPRRPQSSAGRPAGSLPDPRAQTTPAGPVTYMNQTEACVEKKEVDVLWQ